MSYKVSYFNNVSDTKPKEISLDKWLKNTIKPPEELEFKVTNYRKSRNKSLKTKIPCATISATFKKKRNLDNIKNKNPFIVLDIDRYAKNKKDKCNLCLDFDLVKQLFENTPSCYYAGYSVSSDGKKYKDGLYAVIKLDKKTTLIKAFKYFKRKLSRIGVNLDESCKDYTRLRFFSIDKNAYYNPKAKPFKIPKKRKIKAPNSSNIATKSDIEKVESIVSIIESNSIDITQSYEDWYKIAGALYNGFGESGRSYFHKVSKFYPDYKYKKTDNKFNSCRNMKNVSLSTFFHIATNYGIRY